MYATLLEIALPILLVIYEQVRRWDGKLSTVSGGATPFIDLSGTLGGKSGGER